MSITILNYYDQTLVDNVTAQVAERAAAASAAAASAAEATRVSTETDFSTVLSDVSGSYTTTQNTSSGTGCPENLNSIFEKAAATYGVSVELLTSIAKAESGFNANAVSSAGAVGIMQLMPATAASLGVSNSYDPEENIMGGAKLISQLLSKYSGNVSLALAAYNAGSGNVDKYGGIPPFTETQNYVQKVLSYMNGANASYSGALSLASSSEDTENSIDQMLNAIFSGKNIVSDSLEMMAALLQISDAESDTLTDYADTESSATAISDGTTVDNTEISSAVTDSVAADSTLFANSANTASSTVTDFTNAVVTASSVGSTAVMATVANAIALNTETTDTTTNTVDADITGTAGTSVTTADTGSTSDDDSAPDDAAAAVASFTNSADDANSSDTVFPDSIATENPATAESTATDSVTVNSAATDTGTVPDPTIL